MDLSRRSFVAAAASAALAGSLTAAEKKPKKAAAKPSGGAVPNDICVFIKSLQSMSYEDMGRELAAIGYNGIEGTVRRKGYVEPEKADEELPKLLDTLRKHKIDMTIMTTDVTELSKEHEKLLRLAAKHGVKHYRMGPIMYDMSKPIWDQVQALKPKFKELAALNQDLGIQAVYQNHSGPKNFGAPIWDLHEVIRDLDVRYMAHAFDTYHSTVEGGLSWPIEFSLMQPHLGAVFFKDMAIAEPGGKRKFEVVQLGTGRVDPAFGKMVVKAGFTGPLSIHKEYDMDAPVAKQLADIAKDLATLKSWMS